MPIVIHLFSFLTTFFYLVATVRYIRPLFSKQDGKPTSLRWILLLLGVCSHLIYLVLDTSHGWDIGFFFSLVSILVLLLYLIVEKKKGIGTLGAFVVPIGFMFFVYSSVILHITKIIDARGNVEPILLIHMLCALLATTLFVFAFAVSIALIIQERLIKHKTNSLLFKLPPLRVLDELNIELLTSGFIAMVCAVLFGFVFALVENEPISFFDPSVLWTMLSLAVYGSLLLVQRRYSWRGSRLAWLSVAGFTSQLIAFYGANLIDARFHVY